MDKFNSDGFDDKISNKVVRYLGSLSSSVGETKN